MATDRGVSTVADVCLALLLVVAAMGVLVTFTGADSENHDPTETEYSAQTIAASTMNVSYTLAPAIESYYDNRPASNPYDEDDLGRVAHGPVASLIADIAVTNVTLGGQQLSREAVDYQRAIEEALQTRLVGSRFELSVSAVWTPLDGTDAQGVVVLGEQPPPDADVSTTTLTVSSGIPESRPVAVEAVDGPQDYGAVAQAVANATVTGLFPELETQRALEQGGVGSHLTRYRYERLATVLDGDRSVFEEHEWLDPSSADAAAANAYLSQRLATMFESRLEARHGDRYESATEAARAVSTGTVTLTIRTWTHD
jgi:hypothetical protein